LASLRSGLALYAFRTYLRLRLIREGAPIPLYGLPAERFVELGFAVEQAVSPAGSTVLDVGSERSVLPAYLAAERRMRVAALDLCDYVLDQNVYARVLGLEDRLVGEVGDATRLQQDDDSMDLVTCISTIEHLPGEGDTACAREMARVLRPGGRLILTTPVWYATRDVYLSQSFYDRVYTGEPLFFERIYNPSTLFERLVEPSGLTVLTHQSFFTVKQHPLLGPSRALWRQPTRGVSALLESLTYTDVWPLENSGNATYGVACMVLTKPETVVEDSRRVAT
jgi:ubiquinone/menaquinone biosynthesis C-methylase UbiE